VLAWRARWCGDRSSDQHNRLGRRGTRCPLFLIASVLVLAMLTSCGGGGSDQPPPAASRPCCSFLAAYYNFSPEVALREGDPQQNLWRSARNYPKPGGALPLGERVPNAYDIDQVTISPAVQDFGFPPEVHTVLARHQGTGPGTITLGELMHFKQSYEGQWSTSFPVREQGSLRAAERPGFAFTRVSLSSVEGELRLCAVTNTGQLRHVFRRNGQFAGESSLWVANEFSDVELFGGGERGNFVDVGCSGVFNPVLNKQELHVCGVTDDGHLWHTTEISGTHPPDFLPLQDVELASGQEVGEFVKVDCAANKGQLHLVAVTKAGRALHIIRNPSGGWSAFTDVMNPASPAGSSYLGTVSDIGIGFCNEDLPENPSLGSDVSQLNIVLETSDGLQHTIRSLNPLPWRPLEPPTLWKVHTALSNAIGAGPSGGLMSGFSIDARPFFPSYELAVTVSGAGTVGSDPGGIDCGATTTPTCLWGYDPTNVNVRLSSVPSVPLRLLGWGVTAAGPIHRAP
jgi:hypothetical protein